MGLDMFLTRRQKNIKNEETEEVLYWKKAPEEVLYWRKANQIRNWIVNHTELEEDDNLRAVELSKDVLEDLKNDCELVLENHDKAEEIMPTCSGFFFGSTEYDEYYFDILKYTTEKIEIILNTTDFETEVIEYEDWW